MIVKIITQFIHKVHGQIYRLSFLVAAKGPKTFSYLCCYTFKKHFVIIYLKNI